MIEPKNGAIISDALSKEQFDIIYNLDKEKIK